MSILHMVYPSNVGYFGGGSEMPGSRPTLRLVLAGSVAQHALLSRCVEYRGLTAVRYVLGPTPNNRLWTLRIGAAQDWLLLSGV